MAFMVPLVKNHYDIYARNNPADHGSGGGGSTGGGSVGGGAHSNSLFLSATSLKSGTKKQYRIILTGGQVVSAGGGGKKKSTTTTSTTTGGNCTSSSPTKSRGSASTASTCGPNSSGKRLYYRLPSASISLPVGATRPRSSTRSSGKGGSGGGSEKETGARSTPTSPDRNSPGGTCGLPPPPSAFRRSLARNASLSGRVYSYSVSIPEYVAEEPEPEVVVEAAGKSAPEEEDKENQQLLSLFATSAPGGTGHLEAVVGLDGKKKVKKPLVQKSVSLPASPTDLPPARQPKPPLLHSSHNSSTTASSTPENSQTPSPAPSPTTTTTTTSREYIELLRKFILHLKMLKIGNSGGSSSKQKKNSIKSNSSSKSNNSSSKECPVSSSVVEASEEEKPKRARKRKDTMEDSKDL